MNINLKYYPTIENVRKLWSALGSLQKQVRTIVDEGGGSSEIPTLQEVTTAGKTTSNALYVTGADNLTLTDGMLLMYSAQAANFLCVADGVPVANLSLSAGGVVSTLQTVSQQFVFETVAGGLMIGDTTNSGTFATFSGTVQISPGTQIYHAVTKQQLDNKRGVAVANATDAASVITQFNALLTSLRNANLLQT